MVGWVGGRGGGGGECLARRLAHRLDRAAADWARHELAELVKVDCEGAGVREKKDHRWSGGEVVRSRGEVARWFGGQVARWSVVWWPGVSRQLDCQGGEEWRG